MSTHIFMTGFPGFIASRLIIQLVETRSDLSFHLLIQDKFKAQAEIQRDKIVAEKPFLKDLIQFYSGDITMQNCGLHQAQLEFLNSTIHEVWHLAAVYDLTIDRDRALIINVDGTKNVLHLIKSFKQLQRHFYISTAYVSGDRTGTIFEEELNANQQFRNYYEETKFLAEVEVKKTMNTIPTTIFRPAIVVGDSKNGETQKFDGPYFVIRVMDKLPKYFAMTMIGSGSNTVNLVPVDFLISAMSYLSSRAESKDKIYHLTDPNPQKQLELIHLFARLIKKHFIIIPIPAFLMRFLLNIKPIKDFTGLPKEFVGYFDHPHKYDCSNTIEDLKGSGISVPKFESYAGNLIDYYFKKKAEFQNKQAMF